MKKTLNFLTVLVLIFTLSSCGNNQPNEANTWVNLPDLNYLTEIEVINELDKLGVNYIIKYSDVTIPGYESIFIMFEGRAINDLVNLKEEIIVIVYPPLIEEQVELPEITDLSYNDAVNLVFGLGLFYNRVEVHTNDITLDDKVIGYEDYEAFDLVGKSVQINITVYEYFDNTIEYFEVATLEYDGPYLDESFSAINYIDPRGGYFDVTIQRCTDGDTAKFYYPNDIYEAIASSAKSVRFLNMDTEETYSGGEEEWGKPASLYTCSILNNAVEIIIQTDPGDGLLDTHGRLLGWIWVKLPNEDEFFLLNYMVVMQGLAQVKYEFGGGTTISYGDNTYNEWMHIAENYAKEHNLGQWGNTLDYYWDYEQDSPNYGRWN